MADKEIGACRELIDRAIREEDWVAALRNLVRIGKGARTGRASVDAMKLLLAYGFERPGQKTKDEAEGPDVEFVEHREAAGVKTPADFKDGKVGLYFHPGQWRAWDSEARFVAVLAGTQGGKTSFGPFWLLNEMQRRGPGDALVVTPTFPLLEVKLLVEFRRLFGHWLKLGHYTSSPSRRFAFSEDGMRRLYRERYDPSREPSRVLFGHAGNSESLESATVVAAWLDEAGQKHFRLPAWEAIVRRLSLAQGRALITTSVYSPGWLKDKHDRWQAGDKDWEFISFDSTLNPSFPKAEFERARRDLPAWRFNMQYRGQFERPAGLIYDCFDEKRHLCPRFAIPPRWPRFMGLDFGGKHTAAVLLAEEPRRHRLFVFDTYHEGKRTIAKHAARLLMLCGGRPLRSVGGAQSEEQWRMEFRDGGLPVAAPPISDVEVGIQRVYTALAQNELIIFDDLAELRDELTSYSRETDEAGQVSERIEDKEDYHLLDALRYILSELVRGPASSFASPPQRVLKPFEERREG